MASEVLVPSSPAEAVALFGDGAGTTVIGGGTVVVPDITYGRLDPGRVLLLSHAGLDGITVDGDTITIGATTPIDALLELEEQVAGARGLRPQRGRLRDSRPGHGRRQPLRRPARGAARRPPGLPARARRARCARPARTGSGRSRSRSSSPHRHGRLVLDVGFERPAASAFVGARVPAHARVHGARRDRRARTADGDDPARRDRRRRAGHPPPLGRGARLGPARRRERPPSPT